MDERSVRRAWVLGASETRPSWWSWAWRGRGPRFARAPGAGCPPLAARRAVTRMPVARHDVAWGRFIQLNPLPQKGSPTHLLHSSMFKMAAKRISFKVDGKVQGAALHFASRNCY